MISESQQEQAALYALGLLDADEAAEFERLMDSAGEVSDLARDYQEASAFMAYGAESPMRQPSEEVKLRIMRELDGQQPNGRTSFGVERPPADFAKENVRKVIPFSSTVLPWAIAALLAVCCYLLVVREGRLNGANKALRNTVAIMSSIPAAQPLANVSLCLLEPTEGTPSTQPRATVAWDSDRQEGVIQIVQLTPPAKDKDYQLWAVEDGRKDPVSAGLVRVDNHGQTQTLFKPEPVSGNGKVLAFALSIEPAGGSAKNAGPIVLLGKL